MEPQGQRGLRPRSEQVEAGLAAALVLGAMAALTAHCVFLRTPLVDDAAISLAYGLSLFHGDGFRLTHSSQVVEAFSSPLWTVLLGLSVPLRVDPVEFTSVLGIALGVLALPAIALWGPLAQGRTLRVEDAAGPLLCASCTCWAYWTASGMETGLFALLLGAAGALVLRGLATGRFTAAGVVLGLACLTRPEGVLYAGAGFGVWLLFRPRGAIGAGAWRGLSAFAAVTSGYEAFRLVTFGDLLPNTYYAKSTQDFGIGRYLGGFAHAYLPLLGVSAAGLVLCLAVGGRTRRAGLLALGFVLAAVAFVIRFKGDWMREWRFLAPAVPVLTAGLSLGLAAARDLLAARLERARIPRPTLHRWGLPAGALLLTAAAGAAQGATLAERAPLLQRGPELPMEQIAGIARALKPHLDWVGMRRPLIAFPDIGGLGLTLPDAEVIDTGILADLAMGRHRLNYPAAEDYLTSEGMPAYVDVHGPSGYVEHYRKLLRNFAPASQLAPGGKLPGFVWILRGLSAEDDPRCPGSRREVQALTRVQLQARLEALVATGKPVDAVLLWRCAFTYQPDDQLPTRAWRARLADLSEERAHQQAEANQPVLALRYQSLAAVLDNGTPQRRRLAERYRERVFPPPPAVP